MVRCDKITNKHRSSGEWQFDLKKAVSMCSDMTLNCLAIASLSILYHLKCIRKIAVDFILTWGHPDTASGPRRPLYPDERSRDAATTVCPFALRATRFGSCGASRFYRCVYNMGAILVCNLSRFLKENHAKLVLANQPTWG